MKTRTAQLTAAAGIAIAVALLASPWVIAATSTTSTSGASTSSSSTSSGSPTGNANYTMCQQSPGPMRGFGREGMAGPPGQVFMQSGASLTVGQTITVTSTQGEYHLIGDPSVNGTASGTITFTVTSKLDQGYTLSMSSGTIVVDGTSYTIASGSAQTGRSADVITGQGSTTPTGEFLLQGFARGSFSGTTGQLLLDFQAGSTEYAVALSGSIQS